MAETTTVIHLNQKYEMSFEQAASSTKGIVGFKVSAHGDNLEDVKRDIRVLLQEALDRTAPPQYVVTVQVPKLDGLKE